MKITTSLFFEIEEYLTEQVGLVEEAFIQEMTDHFVLGIEQEIVLGWSFDEGFARVLADLGGMDSIKNMERAFQKSILKKALQKSKRQFVAYAKMPKLNQTAILVAISIMLNYYIGFENTRLLANISKLDITVLVIYGGFPLMFFMMFVLRLFTNFFNIESIDKDIRQMHSVACMFCLSGIFCVPQILVYFDLSPLLNVVFLSISMSFFGVLILSESSISREYSMEEWYQPR